MIEESDGSDHRSSWGDSVSPAIQNHIYSRIPAPASLTEAWRRRREAMLVLDSIDAEQAARRARAIAEKVQIENDPDYQDWLARTQRARRHWVSVLNAIEHWISCEPPEDLFDEGDLRRTVTDLVEILMREFSGAPSPTAVALRRLRQHL